jgi:hypothetical protein
VFEAIEALSLAVWLRQSIWIYPLVNTLHILGVALLIGSVVVLDLRLLGLWRRVPASALAAVLGPTAIVGFGLAASAGALLFIARAADYAPLWLFQVKMGLLVLALVNGVAVLRAGAWRRLRDGQGDTPIPASLRTLAATSLILWLAVMTFGRLVGYA